MEKSISSNLCKGLRACGIPKRQTHQILNVIQKWYDCSGPEWTNSRIKDLRQWYETCLTGNPVPPSWFKHDSDGYPLGIWKYVFDQVPAKALGVLSLNTVLYEHEFTETQKEKFLHGLAGNGKQTGKVIGQFLDQLEAPIIDRRSLPKAMPAIQFPTLFDMTGSIPVHECQSTVRPENKLGEALKALRLSWESVPQVTFDFLDRMDLLGFMPMEVLGNEYQLELNRPHERTVGRVSVLQQPQLKARVVGNPNRVMQTTLEPLKQVYMNLAKRLPSDVTHDQELGVAWVQSKLRQGIELAGSDLTSASDLLEVSTCLDLVDRLYGLSRIDGYKDYADYFYEVSRAEWFCPALGRNVKWEQGDVLGTGPSFGLLTLSNNACATLAWAYAVKEGQLDPNNHQIYDSFRVVGDDIVMLAPMADHYNRLIEDLGGEINHSKTLQSNKVAEFAGRVITSDASYLKAIKYSEPSDNSFMNYMAQLGDQAKYFLRPKQRETYDLFKEVPGIIVNGPWMQDSYGIPLTERYQWYLEEVEPVLSTVEPDLPLEDYEMLLLKAELSLQESDQSYQGFDEPWIDEGYLPSQVTPTFKVGGDPRLTNGKTTLDVLHEHVSAKDIRPFEDWLSSERQTSSPEQFGLDSESQPLEEEEINDLDLDDPGDR